MALTHIRFNRISTSVSWLLKIILATLSAYCIANILSLLGFIDISNILYRNSIIAVIVLVCLSFDGRYLLLSQVGLSLSPFLFLNEKYLYNEEVILFTHSPLLIAIILIASIVTLVISLQETKNNNSHISTAFNVLVLVLITQGFTRFFFLDEYHLGEVFTAYHQSFILNQQLYTEYIPTKGFMHIIIGFINEYVFNGNYISITEAKKITSFLFGLALIIFLNKFYKQKTTLLLLALGLPVFGHFFPVLIGLLILSNKKNRHDDYLFIISYLLFCSLYVLYYSAFGIAFAASILPIVIYRSYSAIKAKKAIELQHYSLICIGLCIFGLTFNTIFASIDYSLANASANLLYWGMHGSVEYSLVSSNLWGIQLITLFFLIYTKQIKVNRHNAVWISFFALFPFLIITYLEGRSDGYFYRAYIFTLFYSTIIASFALSRKNTMQKKAVAALLVSALLPILYHSDYSFLKIIKNKFSSFEPIHIDSNLYTYVNDSIIPNIGTGFVDVNRLDDLEQEYKLIQLLHDDETFLMIDSHLIQSARYTLYNKRVPTISHAVLNIPSLALQAKELEKVKNEKLQLIRLTGWINRYHLFHKYTFSLGWSLINYNNRMYLSSPDFLKRISDQPGISFTQLPLPLDSFSTRLFGILPVKWGGAFENESSNLSTTKADFELASLNNIALNDNNRYILSDNDPHMIFNVKEPSKLNSKDLITLKLEMPEPGQCAGQIFWSSNDVFSERNSVLFNIADGYNTIPIGMNLHWKLGPQINRIRLDFDNCKNQTITIDSILLSNYNYN